MAKPCEYIGVKTYLQKPSSANRLLYYTELQNEYIKQNIGAFKGVKDLLEPAKLFDYRLYKSQELVWTKDSGCNGDFIGGTEQCTWNFTSKKPHPLTVTGYAADNVKCSGDKLTGIVPFTTKNCVSKRDGKTFPLYLYELYSNACADSGSIQDIAYPDTDQRKKFCDSITDLAGNKRVPRSCGGTDPDIIDDDIATLALDEAQKKLAEISDLANKEIERKIKEKRKKIFFLLIMFAIIIYIIYY